MSTTATTATTATTTSTAAARALMCERRVWLSAQNPDCSDAMRADLSFDWVADGACRQHLEPHMAAPDFYTARLDVSARKISVAAFKDASCALSLENFTDTVEQCAADGMLGWKKWNCSAAVPDVPDVPEVPGGAAAAAAAATTKTVSVIPELNTIRRNLILNKDYQFGSEFSDWGIDHDDASSWYEDANNVLVYGAHKWRDGIHKHYVENLYVTPPDAGASQTWGVGWYTPNTNASAFLNNTFVSFKPNNTQFHYVWSVPGPALDFNISGNRYFTPSDASLGFRVAGRGGMGPTPPFAPSTVATLAQWQALTGSDAGATISADMDLQHTLAMAEEHLGLAPSPPSPSLEREEVSDQSQGQGQLVYWHIPSNYWICNHTNGTAALPADAQQHEVARCKRPGMQAVELLCEVAVDGSVSAHFVNSYGNHYDGEPVTSGCSCAGGASQPSRAQTGGCCVGSDQYARVCGNVNGR